MFFPPSKENQTEEGLYISKLSFQLGTGLYFWAEALVVAARGEKEVGELFCR